tara:strand:- start:82 stop:534 length:453 start_codon:yes stop_codon:yes gene_type:complete
MSLSAKIMEAMKVAMKNKDALGLQALRSVKSAILLAQTQSGAKEELTEEAELKLLQKLVKQRKDSAAIYSKQGRADLADPEIAEAAVIEAFLPQQLSQDDVAVMVDAAIEATGASSMADMGKVMGMVNAKVAGRADGKTISTLIKARLSS